MTTLPPIDGGRARDLVGRFTDLPVLVVGDVMLDRFVVGRVTRISPEAPVPIPPLLRRAHHQQKGRSGSPKGSAMASQRVPLGKRHVSCFSYVTPRCLVLRNNNNNNNNHKLPRARRTTKR